MDHLALEIDDNAEKHLETETENASFEKRQQNYQNINESKVKILAEKLIMSLEYKIATVTVKVKKIKK